LLKEYKSGEMLSVRWAAPDKAVVYLEASEMRYSA
jgi:hypothetical protein